MRLSREKKVGLAELVKLAVCREIHLGYYESNEDQDVYVSLAIGEDDTVEFHSDSVIKSNHTFTVDTEEEITEDTPLPKTKVLRINGTELSICHYKEGVTIREIISQNDYRSTAEQIYIIADEDRPPIRVWTKGYGIEKDMVIGIN